MSASTWIVEPSLAAKRTINPIRNVVDQLKLVPNPEKRPIKLSIGDPTLDGNFRPPAFVTDTLFEQNSKGLKYNGYAHSCGYPETRLAVAHTYSIPDLELTLDDVVITSGCSGAIDMAMGVLGNEGDVFLIPLPGFSLYETVAGNRNFKAVFYPLLSDQDWKVDIERLKQLIEEQQQLGLRVAGLVVINPSNPCGSVYSKEHLQEICHIAETYRVPIIADEMYGGLVFSDDVTFTPIASQSGPVPVLSLGGIAKQFMCPGWRVGWVICYDRTGAFKQIRQGLVKLSQVILGANSLAQSVVPSLLIDTPQSYRDEVNDQLRSNCDISFEMLQRIDGLRPSKPKGTFYMMVEIDRKKLNVEDDMDFTQKLVEQQSVYVLPGSCFKMNAFFRIIFSSPRASLIEAIERIDAFCQANRRPSST